MVIVSGYEEFDYARKAIEYEVKQYIIKPVKRELLLRVLRQLEEKQENFRREVEAGVLERLKKLPNGYTCLLYTSPGLHLGDNNHIQHRYQEGECYAFEYRLAFQQPSGK